ncbi:MAG: hypothetical protein Q4B77_03420 [Coriobacteriaceae bacterium]|nr:hypothetical protein [Coriobacteriaceae bacterium]
MLRLLRADWYRVTRIRGFRGSLWQYASALLVFAALQIGLILLGLSGVLGDVVSFSNMAPDGSLTITPIEYLAPNLFGNYSVLVFAASFGFIEMVFFDLTDGFGKTLVPSTRGHLAYFGEKVLFAGAWSACLTALDIVITLGGFALFVLAPHGLSFSALDSVGAGLLWCLTAWLATWVASVLPLAIAMLTRSKLVTYGFMIGVLLGMAPSVLQILGMLPGPALAGGSFAFLIPLGDALSALASWMPSTVLHALTDGAGTMLAPAGLPGTGTLPTWAWMLGTCVMWLVLAGGAWIAVGRRRGL